MRQHPVRRGSILIVQLGLPVPTPAGDTLREQAGERPAVVISSDTVLLPSLPVHRILTVVPGTTTARGIETHLEVGPNQVNNLANVTYFMAEQVRSIDVRRVIRIVGAMTQDDLSELDALLRWCFDI